jgi:hypothetical protein
MGTVSGRFWPTPSQARPDPAGDVAHYTESDGAMRNAHDAVTTLGTSTAARPKLACPGL